MTQNGETVVPDKRIECRTVADLPAALVPYFEAVIARLAESYDDWPDTDDGCSELASDTIRALMPRGKALWGYFATSADLGRLASPGCIADTIEGVVEDVFCEALAWPVDAWMLAHDASAIGGSA